MRQREELVNTLLQKKVELEARIVELEAQLAAANAESLNTDMVIVDLKDQIAGAKAEIARLRSGGCAREQGATQYCAEAQRLAGDAAMLDWIADSGFIETVMEGELNVHEAAHWIAYEREVDAEPTVEDYRQALRHIIRAAINAEAAHSGEGE